jgi:hypothetical protein
VNMNVTSNTSNFKESLEKALAKVRKPENRQRVITVFSEAGYIGSVGTAIGVLVGTLATSGISAVVTTAAWVAGLWKGMEWAFPQLTARTRTRTLLAGLVLRAMLDDLGKKPEDLSVAEQVELARAADRLAIQLERAGKYRI